MAIDEVPADHYTMPPADRSNTGALVAAFLILAVLVIGQIYTLSKLSSLKEALQTQDNQTHQKILSLINDEVGSKISAMENANAQELDALRAQISQASKGTGTSKRETARWRAALTKLQQEEAQQTDVLKQQIASKADQQQVGALSQDVTATKADLESAKKNVNTLGGDLGMARSELGTLTARNHDEIETLRKLGQRNYYEFTLNRNQEQKVAGVGLILKKTNVKHHRFNVTVLSNDMAIDKNNRTIDEPIFLAADSSKGFYELVVNKVDNNTVSGYLSTAKYSGLETAELKSDANQNPKADDQKSN